MQLLRVVLQILGTYLSLPTKQLLQDAQVHDRAKVRNASVSVRQVSNASQSAAAAAPAPRAQAEGCDPIEVLLGVNELKFTLRPIGNCDTCCRVKIRKDIRLLLYTKSNPTTEIQLQLRAGSLSRAGFNAQHPTIVFVHGFTEVCKPTSSSYVLRDAYLGRPEPYNVILVDWTNLSAAPWYGQAAENTIIVADVLAKYLRIFHKSGELSLGSVHLIGFSLGAHIIGMASRHLRPLHFMRRITGLDAAQPLYPVGDVKHRLTKDDAEFVDIIHTTANIGYSVSIGHVDFYVNPGTDFQPGCTFHDLVLRQEVDDFFSCSHRRAWNVYAETVANPGKYPASRCDANRSNCEVQNVYMGFNVSWSSTGDYYVQTA